MGLAKIIFGFDREDLKKLEEENKALKAELSKLKEENTALDSRMRELEGQVARLASELKQAYSVAASLVNEIEVLKNRVAKLEDREEQREAEDKRGNSEQAHDLEETVEVNEEALESYEGDEAEKLVLEAISKGVNSPSDIVSYTGLSKSRVYSILKELTEEGVLVKKKEGRRVHYIMAGAGAIESPA
ncbi:MAG: hypothetical protein GSR73_00945 [Desulfurococcales archaeon]|nr:hypothetical protein [Desulfurococcales archaeon]